MIYLDNAATTKPNVDALEYAKKFNTDLFFNPSALYKGGLNNKKELENTKHILLNSLSSLKHEVIFTSCGTESDNMAIFGAFKRGVFVTTEGEHSAVYKCAVELKNRGFTVLFAKLNKDGSVNQDDLINLVKNNNVTMVSIVHVNNETGAINDINLISKKIKAINPSIIYHSDGVQAYLKLPYKLSDNVDLYSISAHKVNALKGIGALIKKKGLNINPIIFGGGQENGLRSGTENIFGIKVLEYCITTKHQEITNNFNNLSILRNTFLSLLNKDLFTVISSDNSSPYILCLSANGLKGEVVLHMLEDYDIIIGNGSACSSKNRYSRVIEACGYKNNDGIIRISFSTETTEEEIKYVAEKLNEVTLKLKKIMKVNR